MAKKKVLIMGAAGRDFHNFNVIYRDNPDYDVVAFTATQIPDIEGRKYPKELAGELYPEEVAFSYSDVPYEYVMSKSSIVNALGASFRLVGLQETWIELMKPPSCAIWARRLLPSAIRCRTAIS